VSSRLYTPENSMHSRCRNGLKSVKFPQHSCQHRPVRIAVWSLMKVTIEHFPPRQFTDCRMNNKALVYSYYKFNMQSKQSKI
jgi:hypothetical protein